MSMIPAFSYPTRGHGLGEIRILLLQPDRGARLMIPSIAYLDLGVLPLISQVSRHFMLWLFLQLYLSLGSSVSVIGIFLSSTLPSWTCLIDGYTKPTPSNLTVVASGTKDSPFLFDYIQYVPVASTILDNATVVVDAFDSQIQYDSGWNNLGTTGMQMSVQDASMTCDFVGALHS